MKKLTIKQQKKADKIVHLLNELKNDGVNPVLVASLGTKIIFGRGYDFDVDHDEFLDLLNDGEFYTPPQNNYLIDCRGL